MWINIACVGKLKSWISCVFFPIHLRLTVDDQRNSNYLEVGHGNQYDYLTLNFGVSDKPLARQGLLKT